MFTVCHGGSCHQWNHRWIPSTGSRSLQNQEYQAAKEDSVHRNSLYNYVLTWTAHVHERKYSNIHVGFLIVLIIEVYNVCRNKIGHFYCFKKLETGTLGKAQVPKIHSGINSYYWVAATYYLLSNCSLKWEIIGSSG